MSASVARMPPCTLPRVWQCLRSQRRPRTRSSPLPRAYTGPIRSMVGLRPSSDLNPAGITAGASYTSLALARSVHRAQVGEDRNAAADELHAHEVLLSRELDRGAARQA